MVGWLGFGGNLNLQIKAAFCNVPVYIYIDSIFGRTNRAQRRELFELSDIPVMEDAPGGNERGQLS